MFWRIVLSAMGISAGFVLIVKTRAVVDFTGTNDWVDRTFGDGQTYNFYKVVGIVVIFVSFLYLIGDLDPIMRFIVKLFVPSAQQ